MEVASFSEHQGLVIESLKTKVFPGFKVYGFGEDLCCTTIVFRPSVEASLCVWQVSLQGFAVPGFRVYNSAILGYWGGPWYRMLPVLPRPAVEVSPLYSTASLALPGAISPACVTRRVRV